MALSKFNRTKFFPVRDGVLDLLGFQWIRFNDYLKDKATFAYVIQDRTANRPDLISFDIYQSVQYWWILCQVNSVIDPLSELTTGRRLVVPTLDDIESFYSEILVRQRRGSSIDLPTRTV